LFRGRHARQVCRFLPRQPRPFPAKGAGVGAKLAKLGLSARRPQKLVEQQPATIESAHPRIGNRRLVRQDRPFGRLRQIVVVSETGLEASRREVELGQTFVCRV
jgi:hypothetical protein